MAWARPATISLSQIIWVTRGIGLRIGSTSACQVSILRDYGRPASRHAELLARRQRRREELQQQQSLTLQAAKRMTSALVLPHPDRESPEVRRLRPNLETEATAMQVVMDHERSQGCEVYDVSPKR